jgi:hypothetical protein
MHMRYARACVFDTVLQSTTSVMLLASVTCEPKGAAEGDGMEKDGEDT